MFLRLAPFYSQIAITLFYSIFGGGVNLDSMRRKYFALLGLQSLRFYHGATFVRAVAKVKRKWGPPSFFMLRGRSLNLKRVELSSHKN